MSGKAPAQAPCRLYLISPPAIADLAAFADALAAALEAGDVAAVQLRLKQAGEDDIARAAERLLPLTRARDAALILNDRPDLAVRLGLDGVHVGQSDATADQARALVGGDRIVGVTCHASRRLAMEAAEAGADYVAFGAFFPTATKATTARPDLEILTEWQADMLIPCVAIGGITPANCGPLVAAGADFLAVSSAVWEAPRGAAAAVRDFAAAIAEAQQAVAE